MFSSLFSKSRKKPLRLVVGVNQVDKMCINGWNERLNLPTEEAEVEIKRRSTDVIKKLTSISKILPEQLEYYSALKRYRLIPLLSKIIRNAYAGFKFDHIQPAGSFDLADPDVKEFYEQELNKRTNKENGHSAKDKLFYAMQQILSAEEFKQIQKSFQEENSRPPKVAILGKTGVGKTTTINSVFNAKWKTSHTIVGTTKAQMKEFELINGGSLTIVDLPGYGRSIAEDREYEKIYQDMIPSCDLVLLVVQANSKDLADDQEMILKITEWLKSAPQPLRLT